MPDDEEERGPGPAIGDAGVVMDVIQSGAGACRHRVVGFGDDGRPRWDQIFERGDLHRQIGTTP